MPAAKKARIESYADHKGLAGEASLIFSIHLCFCCSS